GKWDKSRIDQNPFGITVARACYGVVKRSTVSRLHERQSFFYREQFFLSRAASEMFRSWKIGTMFGIGIYVHATFSLLPAFVFLANLGQIHFALYMVMMIPAV